MIEIFDFNPAQFAALRGKLELVVGDIVDQDVDAIVNAANESLLGGGGVDGAIHDAAGPELLDACRKLGGCPTGSAKITPGFKLKARRVIHAVGPVYGTKDAFQRLHDAYRISMELAEQHGLRSIAFPAISTGAYRYPLEEAAGIALRVVAGRLSHVDPAIAPTVRFVLFDKQTHAVFRRVLADLLGTH